MNRCSVCGHVKHDICSNPDCPSKIPPPPRKAVED